MMLSPGMHVILETTPEPMTKRLAHVALPSFVQADHPNVKCFLAFRSLSCSILQLPQYSSCHLFRSSSLLFLSRSLASKIFWDSVPLVFLIGDEFVRFSRNIAWICLHLEFSSRSQFSHSALIISLSTLFTTRIATIKSCRYEPKFCRVRRSRLAVDRVAVSEKDTAAA